MSQAVDKSALPNRVIIGQYQYGIIAGFTRNDPVMIP